ncbi:MAG: hypothetical protein ACPF9D_02140 [Owenweeksia sp.]
MKKVLLAVLILSGFCARAEYNGCFFKLSVEKMDGTSFIGHLYMTDAIIKTDSLNNNDYLVWNSGRGEFMPEDSIRFYKKRLSYIISLENQQDTIYTLLEPMALSKKEIRNIRVLDKIEQSYLYGLEILHESDDYAWLSKKPQTVLKTGGYLCDWEIFIHEESPQTNEVQGKLRKYEAEAEAKLKKLSIELNSSDGPYHRELQENINSLEERLDTDIPEILKGFKGEKVVILAFCSC